MPIIACQSSRLITERISHENVGATLVDLGQNANIYICEVMAHAFANPLGQNYASPAAEDAWDKTLRFLIRHPG